MLDHQRGIVATLNDGDALLSRFEPSQAKALALVRWQLLRRLRNYQLFKHGEVLDPLIAGAAPARAALARAMKDRCLALGQAHLAYVEHWSVENIYANWPDYITATQAMTNRIRHHLERESEEVGSLLAGFDQVRTGPRG